MIILNFKIFSNALNSLETKVSHLTVLKDKEAVGGDVIGNERQHRITFRYLNSVTYPAEKYSKPVCNGCVTCIKFMLLVRKASSFIYFTLISTLGYFYKAIIE